jgi:DNA repair protein RadC
MKLKDLPKIDLPREKLEKYGQQKLADHELLAILLGSGIKGVNVLELSKNILALIQEVRIENLTLERLLEVKGLGNAKAAQVMSALIFAKRFTDEKPQVLTERDVWHLCPDIRGSNKEHLVVFYLDTRRQLIERRLISIGTLDSSLIHPREVYEPAIKLSAAYIKLVHNHPSGVLEASWHDKEITEQMIRAGEILGIEMDDHIIVSKDGFISHRKGEFEFRKN